MDTIEVGVVQALITGLLAAIPGIPPSVAQYTSQFVAQLPSLVAAGTDIKEFLEAQLKVVRSFIEESRDPTDEEWIALNEAMAAELIKLSNQANSA